MYNIEIPKFSVLRGGVSVESLKNLRALGGRRRSYIKERTKQKEHLNTQIAHLDKLLKHNSIDENMHARYEKLLEINYEKEREETRTKYGFTNSTTTNLVS